MAHIADIQADLWAIIGALVISLLVSIVFIGWLMQVLINRQARSKDKS